VSQLYFEEREEKKSGRESAIPCGGFSGLSYHPELHEIMRKAHLVFLNSLNKLHKESFCKGSSLIRAVNNDLWLCFT